VLADAIVDFDQSAHEEGLGNDTTFKNCAVVCGLYVVAEEVLPAQDVLGLSRYSFDRSLLKPIVGFKEQDDFLEEMQSSGCLSKGIFRGGTLRDVIWNSRTGEECQRDL
jgi:hypothetical protein